MSLDRALQRLATQIDSGRDAKLRMRLGTVDSYTPGSAEVSVVVGGDTVDAPFISGYTPAVGDRVIVLFNAGSPIVIGASGATPVSGGGNAIEAMGYFTASDPSAFDGSEFRVPIDTADEFSTTPGYFTVLGSPGFTVRVEQDGLYQCAIWLNPFGAVGDIIRALIDSGGTLLGAELPGYGITAADTGTGLITVSTDVHVCSGGVTDFGINLIAVSGAGPFGLSQARMTIVKFAGAVPPLS